MAQAEPRPPHVLANFAKYLPLVEEAMNIGTVIEPFRAPRCEKHPTVRKSNEGPFGLVCWVCFMDHAAKLEREEHGAGQRLVRLAR